MNAISFVSDSSLCSVYEIFVVMPSVKCCFNTKNV